MEGKQLESTYSAQSKIFGNFEGLIACEPIYDPSYPKPVYKASVDHDALWEK
jgi:hypothetical protein